MFKINLLTPDQANQQAGDLLSGAIYKLSQRIINICRPEGLYVTAPVEWIKRKRSFNYNHYSNDIGIHVDPNIVSKFFPEKIVNACWYTGHAYYAIVDDELFVVGDRYYNDSGFRDEEITDGPTANMSVLGKVGAGEEFVPIIVPRLGLVIMATSAIYFREKDKSKNKSFDMYDGNRYERDDEDVDLDQGQRMKHYHGLTYLWDVPGKPSILDFIPNWNTIVKHFDLDIRDEESKGKIVQAWMYPTSLSIPEYNMVNGEVIVNRGHGVSNHREARYVPGSGQVTLTYGPLDKERVYPCTPWLERAFIQSLK